MAKDKKSFLLYCDLIHTVSELPNDKAGELFKHILEYVNDKDPITDDLIIKISFEPIKQQLKRDLKKYEDIRERNRANARKRWNATASERIPKDTKNADNDTDTVSVNDIVSSKEDEKAVFFENQELNEWFILWLKVCSEKGKPMGQSTIEACQRKLNYQRPEIAIAQVRQSAVNNWVTLRPVSKEDIEREETKEEKEAREVMEAIKAESINQILYGNVQSDNNNNEPTRISGM